MLNRHQFRTYYHGTGDHNVPSIMKHGLKANNPAAGLYDNDEEDPGHPTGVYLTENIETAREYGPAVFSVELPNSAKWKWSENGEVLGHDISPFALKRVE